MKYPPTHAFCVSGDFPRLKKKNVPRKPVTEYWKMRSRSSETSFLYVLGNFYLKKLGQGHQKYCFR